MTQGMAASETHRSGATSLRRSLVDLEHPTTLARRFQRDRLITQTLGGPLPQEFDISGIEQVLDIGCGPGCWALEVADAYRHMQLLGIDVSHTMIEYARSLVAALQLGNVRFLHTETLESLAFPPNSFDLIHWRFLATTVPACSWPALLSDCLRIARPGARLCVTEAELPLSNSSAGTRLSHLISRALKRAGFGFSPPEELDIGIIPRLGDLMRAAGWVEIQFKTHIENLSAGTANHDEWYENYEVMLHLLEPFLRRTTGIEQRELEQVQADFLHDIHSQEFSGVQFFLSAWGSRP